MMHSQKMFLRNFPVAESSPVHFYPLSTEHLSFSLTHAASLFPLYWTPSPFLAAVYLKYFSFVPQHKPLIASFLPRVSSSLFVSSLLQNDICPYKPACVSTGILFVYCFQGPEIWERGSRAMGPVQSVRQAAGCSLSYLVWSRFQTDVLLIKTDVQTR